MASTYSTNLALELIGTGEQSGTWGTTTNTNLGTLLEQAVSGYTTQAITDGASANTTITIPNGTTGVARNMFIEMTGALTVSSTSLLVPANKKMYFIYNNTSGGYAVTVKVAGQTGILVPTGKKVVLTCNGTDIVEAHTAIVGNATMGGTLSVAGATTLSSTLAAGATTITGAATVSTTLGVTGATTLSSTLGVTGATTLSSTLGVTGATTLSSTLAAGATTITGAATVSSTLGVTGAATLSSTLGVTGATTLSSTLGVTGATTLSSTLAAGATTITGAATVSTTLGVTGATTLSSTLGVTGVSTFAAGTALLPALTTTGDTNTGVWFPAADTVAVSTGGAESMRIDSSGNVTLQKNISVGAATVTTSGSGITFPATQSASTNANTLDDYEEGTFTPSFSTSGDQPTISYGTQLGYYVKVGKSVFYEIRIVTSTVSGGTGDLYISGLPFSTDITSNIGAAFPIGYINWATNPNAFVCQQAATRIDIYSNSFASVATMASLRVDNNWTSIAGSAIVTA